MGAEVWWHHNNTHGPSARYYYRLQAHVRGSYKEGCVICIHFCFGRFLIADAFAGRPDNLITRTFSGNRNSGIIGGCDYALFTN